MRGVFMNERETVFEVIPGLLGVKTNSRMINFFKFGGIFLAEKARNDLPIIVKYTVDESIKHHEKRTSSVIFHHYYGSYSENQLYYDRQIFGSLKYRLILRNLTERIPEIIVNKSYAKLPLKVNNILPPGLHLSDLAICKMLELGYLPLSAAALEFEGKAFVLIAPPETGKTVTVLKALKERTNIYTYMSEDMVITNGAEAISCPFTLSFRHHGSSRTFKEKFFNSLNKLSPIFNLVTEKASWPTDTYFIRSKICKKCKIDSIILLHRNMTGDKYFKQLDKKEAFNRVWNLNKYEFTYYRNPLLIAYSFLNPRNFSLGELEETEKRLVKEFVNNSNTIEMTAENPEDFLLLLEQYMEGRN